MLNWLRNLLGCQPIGDNVETLAVPRSSKWKKVRDDHLKEHPACEVCGDTVALNVHHIKPYHLFPELELQPENLITLCESNKHGVSCHLWFGHLGNWTRYNPDVCRDVRIWKVKFLTARLRSCNK